MSVTTITIANPAAPDRNLLNPEVIAGIIDQLNDADRDPAVTGIILTGAGQTFCGGLDIPAMRAGGDPAAFASSLASLLRLLPQLGTPVVAAVNGDALGGGSALVAVSDYVVAAADARLGTHEMSLGIWPAVAQVPLIHRIGARLAMETIGSGEPFTSTRAREVGLVNEIVVDAADVIPRAAAWLAKAERGALAAKTGRPGYYRIATLPLDDGLDAAVAMFVELNT